MRGETFNIITTVNGKKRKNVGAIQMADNLMDCYKMGLSEAQIVNRVNYVGVLALRNAIRQDVLRKARKK